MLFQALPKYGGITAQIHLCSDVQTHLCSDKTQVGHAVIKLAFTVCSQKRQTLLF